MPTYIGAAVNFGFANAEGAVATQFTGKFLLQSATYAEEAEGRVDVLRADGTKVAIVIPDLKRTATLEMIATGSTLSAALSNTALITYGAIISITSCPELPSLVRTNWLVLGRPQITKSNTDVARITFELESYAGITTTPS